MALFRKKKSEGEEGAKPLTETRHSTLEVLNLNALRMVCDKYAEDTLLVRPASIYRPLFRMEEGSLHREIDEIVNSTDGEVESCNGTRGEMNEVLDLLEEQDREGVGSLFVPVNLSMGSTVYSEGEASSTFYFVTRGKLAVFISEPGGEENIELDTISAGDFFGEEALLGHASRPSTVRAIEDSLLMAADAEAMMVFAKRNTRFMEALETVRERRVAGAIAKVLRRSGQ